MGFTGGEVRGARLPGPVTYISSPSRGARPVTREGRELFRLAAMAAKGSSRP